MVSQTIGSRRQVWNGTAKKTPGGLQRSDLIMNKHRRIVSKKKSVSSKKHNRLLEYGYGTEKGHFGFVKTGTKKRGRKGNRGKKMRGGMHSPLNPAGINDSLTLTGGRRRSRSRGMAGGSGSHGLNTSGSASWGGDNLSGSGGISGAGITDFGSGSTDVQMRAGMTGGRKGGRKGGMRGGTTSQRFALSPSEINGGDPLNRALGAS
jgi:hypothetical protein